MKKTSTIAVLIIMVISAMGQLAVAQVATLRHTPTLTGNNSIVREWKEEFSVAYTHTPPNQGYFILDEQASGYDLAFSLPVGVHVTDFEIMNDTVYLCGYIEGTGASQGFLGFFGIEDVFRNGGSLTYGFFNPATHADYAYYDMFTVPVRMDVYEHEGMKHIVAVGHSELSPVAGQEVSSTIVDVTLGGSTWSGMMLFNKRRHEHYTDIVATRDHVVATAMEEDGNACYVKPYIKSANMLLSPLNYGYIWKVSQGVPKGEICPYANNTSSASLSQVQMEEWSDTVTLSPATYQPVITEIDIATDCQQ